MKVVLIFLSLLLVPQYAFAESLKLMSYNIRCGLCEAEGSPQYWPVRKFLLAHLIQTQQPDLIGLQEAELFQVHDLVAMLPQYLYPSNFNMQNSAGDKSALGKAAVGSFSGSKATTVNAA